jgi:hypothetical protein
MAPSPHVQFEEWSGDVVPVRNPHEIETLTFKYWRSVVVVSEPGRRVNDVFDTDQLCLAV